MAEQQLYNVVYSQEKGDEYQMFVAPSKMKVEQLTRDELKERWDTSGQTRDTFGSFDNYMNYVAEASDVMAEADWWNAEGIDTRTNAQKMYQDEDLRMGTPGLSEFKQSNKNARQSEYQQWINSDANQALMQKYGVAPTKVNSDGDQFKWTGSGYVKTVKVDDHASFADYAKIGLIAAMSIAGGQAIAAAIAPASTGAAAPGLSTVAPGVSPAVATAAGSSTAAAAAGTAAGSITSGIVNGVASSVISQGLSGNGLDPSALLQGGVLGAIGGAADALKNGYQTLGTAGEALDSVSGVIQNIADTAGIDFQTATNIVEGVARGTISGGELEDIVSGVATTWSQDWVGDRLQEQFGDTLDIDNFFKESGDTNIPIDALTSVTDTVIEDAIQGDLGAGTLGSAFWDYFNSGGDVDFLLPEGVEAPQWVQDIESNIDDFLPDVDLISGDSFGINIPTEEEKISNAIDERMEGGVDQGFNEDINPDAMPDVEIQYDQEVVDTVRDAIEGAREAGRQFDDEIIQPIVQPIEEVAKTAEDLAKEGGRQFDENVIQPVKDFAESLIPEVPEGPETGITGPDFPSVGTPDVDLDLDLNLGKPFGDNMEAFNPLRAPQMGQPTQLFAKAQTQGYDPRRSGSGVVASLFSEYIG